MLEAPRFGRKLLCYPLYADVRNIDDSSHSFSYHQGYGMDAGGYGMGGYQQQQQQYQQQQQPQPQQPTEGVLGEVERTMDRFHSWASNWLAPSSAKDVLSNIGN